MNRLQLRKVNTSSLDISNINFNFNEDTSGLVGGLKILPQKIGSYQTLSCPVMKESQFNIMRGEWEMFEMCSWLATDGQWSDEIQSKVNIIEQFMNLEPTGSYRFIKIFSSSAS